MEDEGEKKEEHPPFDAELGMSCRYSTHDCLDPKPQPRVQASGAPGSSNLNRRAPAMREAFVLRPVLKASLKAPLHTDSVHLWGP